MIAGVPGSIANETILDCETHPDKVVKSPTSEPFTLMESNSFTKASIPEPVMIGVMMSSFTVNGVDDSNFP